MNVIPTTTAAPILAIDLGKYKSVACVYDPATAQGSSPPSAPRYAQAGDALLWGPQAPPALRPRLRLTNPHLTTRYLLRPPCYPC